MPEGTEEIMRGMFKQCEPYFEEVAIVGGILVCALFPGVNVLIQDATSFNNEVQQHQCSLSVSLCAC